MGASPFNGPIKKSSKKGKAPMKVMIRAPELVIPRRIARGSLRNCLR